MTVTLGTSPVTLADVVAVARDGAKVALAPEVVPRLSAARAVVMRLVRTAQPEGESQQV